MAGNKQKKSSSGFGVFSIFKSKRGGQKVEQNTWEYKVRPSDEDGRWWVAVPSVDRETTEFIQKVRAANQNAEYQAVAVSN